MAAAKDPLLVDGDHIGFVVSFAGRWFERGEAVGLVRREFDRVGCGVLLHSGYPSGARDGGDVVTAGEDPCQRRLRGCRPDLGTDRMDLVDEAKIPSEV